MAFVDVNSLKAVEKRPGWHGRIFHSPSMTFANWEFEKGSSIHEHSHAQEEVWQVIKGKLEMTVDGETRVVGPGMAAIVPSNVAHSVKALSDGKAIVVDWPLREGL